MHGSINLTFDVYGDLFPIAPDNEVDEAELAVVNAATSYAREGV